jgi:AcrR family transcriptional regulator
MAKGEKAGKTRARIISATAQLFLEKGYEDTKIADITSRAGVKTGSFYHQFRTKSAVAEVICLEALEGYRSAIHAVTPPRSRDAELTGVVRAFIGAYLGWITKKRDAARLADMLLPEMRGGVASPIKEKIAAIDAGIASWVARLIKVGKVRDLSPRVISALVLGPAQALCLDWVHGVGNVHPSTYEDTLAEAACAALRAPEAVKVPQKATPPKRGAAVGQKTGDLFDRA